MKMKEFLNKYIFISVKVEDRFRRHKCALVTNISDTHISFIDSFNDKPYFYRICDIVEIKLSNKNPGDVSNGY